MDVIYIALHISVYLSIGSILAELSFRYHDKEHLDVLRHRKAVYVLITLLWPMCVIIFLYQFFHLKGIK